MKYKLLHILMLTGICFFSNAQDRIRSIAENGGSYTLSYGLKFGIVNSSINNLETAILSEPYFLNYTLGSKPRTGWTGGGFINYHFLNDAIAIQAELNYAQQGADLVFNNTEKDFNYLMQFDYGM